MSHSPLISSLIAVAFMILKYKWKEYYGVLFFGQIVFTGLSLVLLLK